MPRPEGINSGWCSCAVPRVVGSGGAITVSPAPGSAYCSAATEPAPCVLGCSCGWRASTESLALSAVACSGGTNVDTSKPTTNSVDPTADSLARNHRLRMPIGGLPPPIQDTGEPTATFFECMARQPLPRHHSPDLALGGVLHSHPACGNEVKS